MLAALIVAGALAVTAVIALTVITLRSRLSPGPALSGRTVVVHTRRPDDQTIRGILYAQHADRWTLRDAFLVTALGETAAGGLQHIPVANIAFVQEITPAQDGKS